MKSSVRFKSFSSGSCGNCYFLGLEEEGKIVAGVLIDAGVSLRRLKKELSAEGLTPDDFSAILVTHDHMDHIRSLGSYCKYLHKPVWATGTLLEALSHHTYTLDHIAAVRRTLSDDDWNEIVPGRISVRCFVVPHDATQTVGYCVLIGERRFVIMTDLGRMTDDALKYASEADVVVVESNYDMDMLMGGPYPHDLKMRICQGNGHLSNDECASAVRDFYHPGLTHIFLCHLSENNNTPALAYASACAAMRSLGFEPSYKGSSLFENRDGARVVVQPLPRRTPSTMYSL